MRTNTKTHKVDTRLTGSNRLAGGYGMPAAKQDSYKLLKRALMSTMLFEDIAYESGSSVAKNISNLVPLVDPKLVYELAVEARFVGQLRHAPLWIAVQMLKHATHKPYVSDLLYEIVNRPDELSEFLALYWSVNNKPIAKQAKLGLGRAFNKFNEYQFGKWNRNNDIKLIDVMRLVHPTPETAANNLLFQKIKTDTLATPDTWEVELSKGGNKRASWTRLLEENKIPGTALLMNLRNIQEAGVESSLISKSILNASTKWLLPLSFFKAAKFAPMYKAELDTLMISSLANQPKLAGHTVLLIDVSGSMGVLLSKKSEFSRLDVAKSLAIIAVSMCEDVNVYLTAGSDSRRVHATESIPVIHGFNLFNGPAYLDAVRKVGGGGIFTRQCLKYTKPYNPITERVIVISDSQDCDIANRVPAPYGKYNYIIDISSNAGGVNYQGIWTAEVNGWSEKFINFIHYMEQSISNDN